MKNKIHYIEMSDLCLTTEIYIYQYLTSKKYITNLSNQLRKFKK